MTSKWPKNAHGTSLANYGMDGILEKIRLGAWIDVDWIKNRACRCLWMDCIGMLDDIETGWWSGFRQSKRINPEHKKNIHEAPAIVRSVKNNFLIAVGCRATCLTKEALKFAKQIGRKRQKPRCQAEPGRLLEVHRWLVWKLQAQLPCYSLWWSWIWKPSWKKAFAVMALFPCVWKNKSSDALWQVENHTVRKADTLCTIWFYHRYPEVQRSLDSPAGKNRFTLEPTGQAVQGHSARGACLAKVIFGSHFFFARF